MTATTPAMDAPPKKRSFKLPSAYTILFVLIVVVAALTYVIPAGRYDYNTDGTPIPNTYHSVPATPQRIIRDSLMAPINGMYGIEGADKTISPYNSGDLFGAIDVALFILVIGGFLGVTMKTGAIQVGIGRIVQRLKGRETADDPRPDGALRPGWHDLRHGRGEPRLLRAHHHGDDRGRVRLAAGCGHPAARLWHRRARLDHQPLRHRHRVGVRGREHQRGHHRPDRHPRGGHGHRHLVGDAIRPEARGRPGRRVAPGRGPGRGRRPVRGSDDGGRPGRPATRRARPATRPGSSAASSSCWACSSWRSS